MLISHHLSLIIKLTHLLLYPPTILPLFNLLLSPANSTTPYTPPIPRKLQLNNILSNFSIIIEHLKPSDMNTEFISSILTHMSMPKISISIVTFKNYNAIIQFSNKSFCDIFCRRFNSITFNPRFSHLYIYIRNSLP